MLRRHLLCDDPGMSFVERDGVKLFYEDGGTDGDLAPLLLVHGWTCYHGHMAAQAAHFGPGRRVVAVDLRGHGQSDVVGPFTIEQHAEDLAWACGQLGLRRPVVSWGQSAAAGAGMTPWPAVTLSTGTVLARTAAPPSQAATDSNAPHATSWWTDDITAAISAQTTGSSYGPNIDASMKAFRAGR